MTRPVTVLSVPSSAGAHWPGQEQGPAALRRAGLVEQLVERGVAVVDGGALSEVRSRPTADCPQNLDLVVDVVKAVESAVVGICREDGWPLVLDGDCTITLGALGGVREVWPETGLVYLDGGPDLRTPEDQPDCCLDAMGVAHMLGLGGTAAELVSVAPRLDASEVVFLGGEFDPIEEASTAHLAMHRIDRDEVAAAPGPAARNALDLLDRPFLVHFDVDVIDFVDLPLADLPQINTGLILAEAAEALRVLLADPGCRGLVVTEVNPDHGDRSGDDVKRLALALADCLR